MREILETAVAQPRFSMSRVYQAVREQADKPKATAYQAVEATLGKPAGKRVIQGLLRFAFFIEPVKTPKIESTKYAVRWGNEVASPDPRHAPYSDCQRIYEALLSKTEATLQNSNQVKLLRAFTQHSVLPYELPIDYKQRLLDAPIHRLENIGFFWDALSRRVIGLRQRLLTGPLADVFKPAYNKIVVKSYLTDRTLTGEYKTNREKRWETHPASVHFALRRDCLEIELVLINQLCYFAGFPSSVQQDLEAQELIAPPSQPGGPDWVSRCPITLEPLSFAEFKKEILSPKHGKAAYQVGHMHPLKATTNSPFTGHTGKNISWISAQGNRIQGEYSVTETRDLILHIIRNYQTAGLVK